MCSKAYSNACTVWLVPAVSALKHNFFPNSNKHLYFQSQLPNYATTKDKLVHACAHATTHPLKACTDVRDLRCVIRIRITQSVKSNQRNFFCCVKRKIRKIPICCFLCMRDKLSFYPGWSVRNLHPKNAPNHASLNEPLIPHNAHTTHKPTQSHIHTHRHRHKHKHTHTWWIVDP